MDGMTSSRSEERASINAQTDLALWRQPILLALESKRDQRAALGILTGLMDSTRRIIQIPSLPKIRPLNILSLPNELLLLIFEYVRRPRNDGCIYIDVSTVKNIRLTCRRFYDTSSHLLMRRIRVRLTRQSFARLDAVSRHPSISKGVREVELYLGPFRDPALAYDIQGFAAYQAAGLLERIRTWRGMLSWNHSPLEVLRAAVVKADALAQSFQEFATGGTATNPEKNHMILKLHKRCTQLYEDQAKTFASLVQDIASAVGRMPTVTRVTIDGRWPDSPYKLYRRLTPEHFDDVELLQEHLLSSVQCGILDDHRPSHPELKLINDFLLSIQHFGTSLTELDMMAPPRGPLPLTPATDIMPVKQLKAITFRPRPDLWMACLLEKTPERWAGYTNFMRSLLRTKSLEKIKLTLGSPYYKFAPLRVPLRSTASILLSCSWPNLTLLHFEGPFHFEELKAVVQPLRQDVNLEWGGCLMSGQWVDVLDFLRERESPNQVLGRDSRSICGQECNMMLNSQHSLIFHTRFCESLATRYIQGLGPSNPVRDWANGQLDKLH